jgi:integrase
MTGWRPIRGVTAPTITAPAVSCAADRTSGSMPLLVTTTGMRRAELAGLRWGDIDFARARLTPRLPRVVVNYQVHESDTKTASGRRSLALDPATLEALREHGGAKPKSAPSPSSASMKEAVTQE